MAKTRKTVSTTDKAYGNTTLGQAVKPPKPSANKTYGNTTLGPAAPLPTKKKGGSVKKKMNYGGMTKMKNGGSKFPDLSGDGKVTQKDILMGRGVIKKKHGGVHGGMADRYKNPKSASMMRYGGKKK